MSVSSHLTPQPEQRLWIILEAMQAAVAQDERKIAAVTGLVAVELMFVSQQSWLSLIALGATLGLGLFSYAPLPANKPAKGTPSKADNLVKAADIAKYTRAELILRLDSYLGGGITSTAYYEDIVGEILIHARLAVRKRRLFGYLCAAAAAGQAAVLLTR